MITERLTFSAKYGRGDELVALFKEWYSKYGKQFGMTGARLYTDATGPMFTVAVESDYADMAAFAKSTSGEQEMFQTGEFQGWFEKMTEVTERGERQLLNQEKLI